MAKKKGSDNTSFFGKLEFVHELIDIAKEHKLPHKIFHLAKYFGMCPECIRNGKRGCLKTKAQKLFLGS